jgi:hypothetical protein
VSVRRRDVDRTPRWVGLHIIWWGGGDWEFTNCVRCGEPLRSARSVQNGYGPSCAGASGIASLVRTVLAAERARARHAIRAAVPVAPHNRRARRSAGARGAAPTFKQLRYLRDLAERAGQPFVKPATASAASRQIERLKQPAK